MGQAKRQQNFRLPEPLIGRLEAVCGRGRRFRDKSVAVETALEALLAPGVPVRWASVANPAAGGTLVRVATADHGAWFEGGLVRTRSGEIMRVRDVAPAEGGLLLTVDRGVGDTAVRDLAAGDEVCQVGHVDLEASPVLDDSAGEGAAGRFGVVEAPDRAADGSDSGSGGLSAAEPPATELGGQGAESAPAPPDTFHPTRERAPFPERGVTAEDLERDTLPAGRAELLEARADSDGHRSAAAQGMELVDLAAWLAERTGVPVAVCRRRIAEARVYVSGSGVFTETHLERSKLDQVKLDGERV